MFFQTRQYIEISLDFKYNLKSIIKKKVIKIIKIPERLIFNKQTSYVCLLYIFSEFFSFILLFFLDF